MLIYMTKWTDHVKSYAAKHKIKYPDALKDPKCKASYKKVSKGKGCNNSRYAVVPTDYEADENELDEAIASEPSSVPEPASIVEPEYTMEEIVNMPIDYNEEVVHDFGDEFMWFDNYGSPIAQEDIDESHLPTNERIEELKNMLSALRIQRKRISNDLEFLENDQQFYDSVENAGGNFEFYSNQLLNDLEQIKNQIYELKHDIKYEQSLIIPTFEEEEKEQSINGNGLKKQSPWIQHVKAFAKKHNMTYFQALKEPKCKASYKKVTIKGKGPGTSEEKIKIGNYRIDELENHVNDIKKLLNEEYTRKRVIDKQIAKVIMEDEHNDEDIDEVKRVDNLFIGQDKNMNLINGIEGTLSILKNKLNFSKNLVKNLDKSKNLGGYSFVDKYGKERIVYGEGAKQQVYPENELQKQLKAELKQYQKELDIVYKQIERIGLKTNHVCPDELINKQIDLTAKVVNTEKKLRDEEVRINRELHKYDGMPLRLEQELSPDLQAEEIMPPEGTGIKEWVSPTAWKDYGTALVKGRDDFPPHVREILTKYGDKKIRRFYACRTPLRKMLLAALNAVSFGAFNEKWSQLPYDKLFHLDLRVELFTTPPVTILLEKNEVIMSIVNPPPPKQETECINIQRIKPITLNQLLEGAKKVLGDKFFKYSAYNNNCQDFVMALLTGSGIGTQENYDFIKQQTKELFKGLPGLRKFANTVTDIGAVINVATEGAGIFDCCWSPRIEDELTLLRRELKTLTETYDGWVRTITRINRQKKELFVEKNKALSKFHEREIENEIRELDDQMKQVKLKRSELGNRIDTIRNRINQIEEINPTLVIPEPVIEEQEEPILQQEQTSERSRNSQSSISDSSVSSDSSKSDASLRLPEVFEGNGIYKGKNYYVQSIVFDKSKFDVKHSRKWLKDNQYRNRAPDVTDTQIRWRQVTPSYIKQKGYKRFRTKMLGKNSGISLILAYK